MTNLHQDEIYKLEDKDIQLQYILGGILMENENEYCHGFFTCDIRCSTMPVLQDERFDKVKKFLEKHNISNSTFLRLVEVYRHGRIIPFHGDFGSFFPELDRVIKDYHPRLYLENMEENDLKEKELLQLVNTQNPAVLEFITKYNLTPVDFMILAKTSINYKFLELHLQDREDLSKDLKNIVKANDLFQSYEFVKEYQKSQNKNTPSPEPTHKSFMVRMKNKFRRH